MTALTTTARTCINLIQRQNRYLCTPSGKGGKRSYMPAFCPDKVSGRDAAMKYSSSFGPWFKPGWAHKTKPRFYLDWSFAFTSRRVPSKTLRGREIFIIGNKGKSMIG
jgi:hypothetical protein